MLLTFYLIPKSMSRRIITYYLHCSISKGLPFFNNAIQHESETINVEAGALMLLLLLR